MEYKNLTNQFSFHTEQAIACLKKKELKLSKQEQLIEYITSDIVSFIMEEKNISVIEAMQRLYSSETFSKLNDIETGLHVESSTYVYDIYKTEKPNGQIIQEEI